LKRSRTIGKGKEEVSMFYPNPFIIHQNGIKLPKEVLCRETNQVGFAVPVGIGSTLYVWISVSAHWIMQTRQTQRMLQIILIQECHAVRLIPINSQVQSIRFKQYQ